MKKIRDNQLSLGFDEPELPPEEHAEIEFQKAWARAMKLKSVGGLAYEHALREANGWGSGFYERGGT
jgi:hypothetical protein